MGEERCEWEAQGLHDGLMSLYVLFHSLSYSRLPLTLQIVVTSSPSFSQLSIACHSLSPPSSSDSSLKTLPLSWMDPVLSLSTFHHLYYTSAPRPSCAHSAALAMKATSLHRRAGSA